VPFDQESRAIAGARYVASSRPAAETIEPFIRMCQERANDSTSRRPAPRASLRPTLQRQELVREVNERARAIHASLGSVPEAHEVFCDRGRRSCVERIEVPAAVVDRVRPLELLLVRAGRRGAKVAAAGPEPVLEPSRTWRSARLLERGGEERVAFGHVRCLAPDVAPRRTSVTSAVSELARIHRLGTRLETRLVPGTGRGRSGRARRTLRPGRKSGTLG